MNRIKYEIFLAKTIDRSRFFRNFCQKCQSKKTKKSKQRSKKSNTTNHIFWFLAIILLPCKKEFKQVGLSRATLDSQVKVFQKNAGFKKFLYQNIFETKNVKSRNFLTWPVRFNLSQVYFACPKLKWLVSTWLDQLPLSRLDLSGLLLSQLALLGLHLSWLDLFQVDLLWIYLSWPDLSLIALSWINLS